MSEIRKTEPFSYDGKGLAKDAEIIRQPPKRNGFQAALPQFSWALPLIFLLGMTAGASLLAYFQKDKFEPPRDEAWEKQGFAAEPEPETIEPTELLVSDEEEKPWKVFPAQERPDAADQKNPDQGAAVKTPPQPAADAKTKSPTSTATQAAGAKGPATTWSRHRVTPGETARVLCRKYQITLVELYRKNGGRFVPQVGRDILVPAVDFPRHEVKKGETLYTIAGKHGVDLQQLVQLNGIRRNRIKVGQVLRLR